MSNITSIYRGDIWHSVKNGQVGYNGYNTALGFNLISIRPNLSKWSAYHRGKDDAKIKAAFAAMNKIITGVMTSEFSYSLSSEWETIQTPLSLIDLGILGDIFVAAGGGEMGAVYKSKKLWKRSGYLTITPKIRVIDVNGDGLPLIVTKLLLSFCTAMTGTFEDKAHDVENTIKEAARGLNDDSIRRAEKAQKDANTNTGMKKLGNQVHVVGEEILQIGLAAADTYVDGISDAFSLKVAPPPLIVEIGRIFKHDDMVLTDVSFTFSQENTINGPMYVDIDLTLTTRKIINGIDDTGMTGTNNVGTVSIMHNGQVIESNKAPIPKSFNPTPPTK